MHGLDRLLLNRRARALLLGLATALGWVAALAASPWPWKSVEQRAQFEARQFNDQSSQWIEGPTIAAVAVSQGRQVVFTYTMRLDDRFTPEMFDRYVAELHAIALGLNCSGARSKDRDFQAGLSFLTIHQDERGRRLGVQRVDQAVCDRR